MGGKKGKQTQCCSVFLAMCFQSYIALRMGLGDLISSLQL